MKGNFRLVDVQRHTRILLLTFAGLILFGGTAQAAVSVSYGDFGPNLSFIENATALGTNVGWCVSGSATMSCVTQFLRWIAVPFTPSDDLVLNSVQLPLVYANSGTNAGVVEIVNNAGLQPGTTVIESWSHSNFPTITLPEPNSGPTSAITTLTSPTHPTLHGGQQYWLVAMPGSDPNTLLFWWGNTFGLMNPATALNGIWQPVGTETGTLPAFAINGTAPIASPVSAGCAGTKPQVCFPSPTQSAGVYNYQSVFTDSGASDVYLPIIDANPDSSFSGTVTDAGGEIDFNVAVQLPVGNSRIGANKKYSVNADVNLITDPAQIAAVWPASQVPGDENAFATPLALLQIVENGDTNFNLSIASPSAPFEGPVVVDSVAISGGTAELFEPLDPLRLLDGTMLTGLAPLMTPRHSVVILDPPLPGRPSLVLGLGAIAVPHGKFLATFAFVASQATGKPVTGQLIYANPSTGDLITGTITSITLAGDTANLSGTCTGKKTCNFSLLVTDPDHHQYGNSIPNGAWDRRDTFAISGTGITSESGNLAAGAIEVIPD